MLLLILGVGLVAVSAWLVMRAGMLPRLRMESHLAQLDGYGVEHVQGDLEGILGTPPTRAIERLAASLGQRSSQMFRAVPRLTPSELHAAGIYSMDLDVVEGYRLLAAGATSLLILAYTVVLTGALSPVAVLIALVGAVLGWEIPAFGIRRRGRHRLAEIDKQLPDLIDLLVASVEAGLSVGASLVMLADRFQGPLGEELRLVLRQQQLGTSASAALQAFSERVDTSSVRAFSRTLVRAEAMGGSIGSVLRNLATDARRRRRAAAKERAAKVPIKLLFPLILFIFPALFVVLLYPAGYQIFHTFSGG